MGSPPDKFGERSANPKFPLRSGFFGSCKEQNIKMDDRQKYVPTLELARGQVALPY